MDTSTVLSDALTFGVLRARAVRSREFVGPNAGHALRQQDLRAGVADRDVPLVAGHIPIQFVVILEKFQAVASLVVQVNGAVHVGRIIDVDFPFQVVALARGFDFQLLSRGIGGTPAKSRRAK